MRLIIRFLRDERTLQRRSRYGLIVAGRAIAIVPVITGLGAKPKTTFSTLASALKQRRRFPSVSKRTARRPSQA
jgi:Flp pilus assembly pilin Flp